MQSLPDDGMARTQDRSVFHALPDPAFRLDRHGVILDFNAAAESARGGPLIAQRIQDTRLKPVAGTLPALLEGVLAQKTPASFEFSCTSDGPETHHEVRLNALPNDQVLALVRDITSHRRAETALRDSDAQFRVLANNITDAFWIRSPDMREVRYVSPAFERIWARPASYLYSNPAEWANFIVPEDREHVTRTFAGLTAGARSLDLEYRITRPDGEVRWVRVRGFQVRDGQDELICHTGIVTDTTDRKLAQAELVVAHKQLIEASRRAGMAEIATNVLHNVGNILNSVTVSAGLIRNTLRSSRAQGLRDAAQMMVARAGDLGDFIARDEKGQVLPGYLVGVAQALLQEQHDTLQELEHLTRSIDHIKEVVTTQQAHAGRAGLVTPARIADLVEDALRMNADALARDQVTVIRAFDPVPRANLDRSRVLQVLVNLIGNARDALQGTPRESRRITVSAQLVGGERLRVSVRDEGEGISELTRSRLFAHGFTTRQHGHGFGLHSCVQAAAEMRGTLTVHSDGPGSGATFTLELPFEAAESR